MSDLAQMNRIIGVDVLRFWVTANDQTVKDLENNLDFEAKHKAKHKVKHKAIIEQFGRFPHRSDILG